MLCRARKTRQENYIAMKVAGTVYYGRTPFVTVT